jgi:hypothetical protein
MMTCLNYRVAVTLALDGGIDRHILDFQLVTKR